MYHGGWEVMDVSVLWQVGSDGYECIVGDGK